MVNVSVFVNFFVVFVLQLCTKCSSQHDEPRFQKTAGDSQSRFGDQLCPQKILEVMSTTTEPNRPLLLVMLIALLLSIPWYGDTQMAAGGLWVGLPFWGFVQVLAYLGVGLVGFVAAASWRTAPACTERGEQTK